MEQLFLDDRLFADDKLKMKLDCHQMYVVTDNTDQFVMSYEYGLASIQTSILEYLHAQKRPEQQSEPKYDMIIYLTRLGSRDTARLRWIDANGTWHKDMQRRFEELATGKSEDPKHKGKHGRPNLDGDGTPPPSGQGQREADNARTTIGHNASEEENLLGQVERVLLAVAAQKKRSALVYDNPDTMFLDVDPQVLHSRKIQMIANWALDEYCCDSYLIIPPAIHQRSRDFVEYLENVKGTEHENRFVVGMPNRNVFRAYIDRLLCLHDDIVCDDVETVAITAEATKQSLKGFEAQVKEALQRQRQKKEVCKLDDLYADEDKVKNREKVMEDINALVGLDEVKEYARSLCSQVDNNEKDRQENKAKSPILLDHILFLGNPGTGKTEVARLFGKLFVALGLRRGQKIIEIKLEDVVSPYNPNEVMANMKAKIDEAVANNSVLFVDEVYRFAEDEWGKQAIQTLITEMENKRNEFTVIMAGYEDRMQSLYRVNDGFKSRIKKTIKFRDYTPKEVAQIVERLFAKDSNVRPLSDEVKRRIQNRLESMARLGGIGNGRGARNLYELILKKLQDRGREQDFYTVLPQDVPEPVSLKEEEARQFMEEFNHKFIGLRKVKHFISELLEQCIDDEERRRAGIIPELRFNNCLFVGNPGTGKTTVANALAHFYYLLGLVSSDLGVVKADLSNMSSAYSGEFAALVQQKFDEARGRVLFLDEAYTLAKDDVGKKIVDQLVQNMTMPEYRDMVVIMAGYTDEMNDLLNANAGLKSRAPNIVDFEDFSPDELACVFNQEREAQGYRISPEEEAVFEQQLRSIFSRRSQVRHYGNARDAKNYFSMVSRACRARVKRTDGNGEKRVLRVCDLRENDELAENLEDVLADISAKYVGMDSLIEQIRSWQYQNKVNRLRSERLGVTIPPMSFNMILTGNAGVGKTTVATCMGRIFAAMGLINHKKPIVMRGGDLQGSFLGQTKDKVNKVFETAQDSLLFIDEAYSMHHQMPGSGDMYGQEAIDSLVGNMTDPKNATTIVVLAGYAAEMQQFLSHNQGLDSRFPKKYHMPDYNEEQCSEICLRYLAGQHYSICEDELPLFRERLRDIFGVLCHRRGFANARTARGVAEAIKTAHESRFTFISEETNDELPTLSDEQLEALQHLSLDDLAGLGFGDANMEDATI